MGFSFTPGTCVLLAAIGLTLIIFAVWSIHAYFRESSIQQQPVLPQVSYAKQDPALRNSLYSFTDWDMTNPRDSTASLTLTHSRYATPAPTYSRSASFTSRSSIHLRDSPQNLTSLRHSIYADVDDIFTNPRNASSTSLVPSRQGSPSSSRAQSMRAKSMYIPESSSNLAALRHSIYGDSSPVFTSPRSSSSSLPYPPPAASPSRMSPRQSSSDPTSIYPRQSSSSLAALRHSLYSDGGPACVHPEEGIVEKPVPLSQNPSYTSLVIPRSRNTSRTNLETMPYRNSCPNLTQSPRVPSISSQQVSTLQPWPLQPTPPLQSVKSAQPTVTVVPSRWGLAPRIDLDLPPPLVFEPSSPTSSSAHSPSQSPTRTPDFERWRSRSPPKNPLSKQPTLRLVRTPSIESLEWL